MMTASTVAFFHPKLNIRERLKVGRLYDWGSHTLRQGLLLGSKQTRHFIDENLIEHVGALPNKGSRVVWTLEGHELHTDKQGYVSRLSVMPVRTANGLEYYLTQNLFDDTQLVLVKTGLLGNPWDYMRRARHTTIWQARQPVHHGARALTDGAQRLIVQNGEDLDKLQFLRPPRGENIIEWVWRFRGGAWAEDLRIPTRRYELWQLSPGAKIFVGDIFGGHEFILANRQGTVVATNVSKQLAGQLAKYGDRRTLFRDPEPALQSVPAAA